MIFECIFALICAGLKFSAVWIVFFHFTIFGLTYAKINYLKKNGFEFRFYRTEVKAITCRMLKSLHVFYFV